MTTNKPLTFYTDRSAAETDDQCGMKHYHNRLAGGKGLVPIEIAEALEVGRVTHEDLALVATMPDISGAAVKAAVDTILTGITLDDLREAPRKAEILYRRLGWLAAFAIYIEPTIRELYEDVGIEKEIALDRDPLIIGITPDRLLRDRKDGKLVYREYKSTVSSATKWLDSWKYAIQIHTSLKAVEEETGEKPKFAQVMGLMKGYVSSSDRRLVHPYAWAYYNDNTGVWTHEYKSGNGWRPMPVWEFPGGIVEWVIRCGKDEALRQFPHTEPIFLNDEMVEGWVARRLAREVQIESIKEVARRDYKVRRIYFEQRTSKCRPPFGDACPYLPLCWNASFADKPELHPDFIPRTPHHDLELIL